MKKIERLKVENLFDYDGEINGESLVYELNLIIDRLNQEVSQPEGKKDDNNWYCECGEPANKGEHICKNNRVENNTEEWKKEFKSIAREYYDRQSDVELVDLVRFVEQLLSERSFSKEELFELKLLLNDTYNKGNRAFESISEKVDRLLSLEK